jgi:hypothetical protein
MQNENPYAAPKARLGGGDAPPGAAWKAVILGLVVDVGGSTVAGIALVLLYGMALGASGASAEEIAEQISHPARDSWFSILGFVIGTGFSILGGYVCARIARRAELKLGAITAALSTLIALVMSLQQEPDMALVATIVTFGAVVSGALAGRARNRQRS